MLRKNIYSRVGLFALAGGTMLAAAPHAWAQTEILVPWNQGWRYDQTGRELGTEWRTASYVEDGLWEGPGVGLLGWEPDTPGEYEVYAPINTFLGVGSTVTNYYFRTFFQLNGTTNILGVVATCAIDDGAVLYLNGTEVARVRVPANQDAATFATTFQFPEGEPVTVVITNLALLRQGLNLLAAEVHQGSAISSDIMWGMKLTASLEPPSTPLSITAQPQGQFVVTGDVFSLSVGVSGSPVSYRWYKDGTPLLSASGSVYTSSAFGGVGGAYYVVVSNALTRLTSAVARVTLLPDTVGPRVTGAVGDTNFNQYPARGVQALSIVFTEPLLGPVSTNAVNFTVYAGNDYSTPVAFTNVNTTFTDRPRIHLWMSDEHWAAGSNYFVVINGVADSKGNVIFPNTRVGVTWVTVTNLVSMSSSWEYHAAQASDPDIYTTDPPWYATNYSTAASPWWADGAGVFNATNDPSLLCPGDGFGAGLAFQKPPTLFRRTFVGPENLGTNTSLQIRHLASDGLLVYLNAIEVYRFNCAVGPVNSNSLALMDSGVACVKSASLPALLAKGSNTLAVALLRSNHTVTNLSYFGLELQASFSQTSPVPAEPPPAECRLALERLGADARLSWSTSFSGYALQYKTNLNPAVPWLTVSNQANPFTLPADGRAGLYRLYNYK